MRLLRSVLKALAVFIVLMVLGAVAASVYIARGAPEGTATGLGAVVVLMPYVFVIAVAVSAVVFYRSLSPHGPGPQ